MSRPAKKLGPQETQRTLTADEQELVDVALRDLLAADSVLPEQFWSASLNSSDLSGELALMWAVFSDGIDCFRRNVGVSSVQGRVDFEEAEAWIFTTDWNWPFSFVNLCEIFGFNPSSLRSAMQILKRDHHEQVRRHRFRPVTRHAA
jgi:hypothetical protein